MSTAPDHLGVYGGDVTVKYRLGYHGIVIECDTAFEAIQIAEALIVEQRQNQKNQPRTLGEDSRGANAETAQT